MNDIEMGKDLIIEILKRRVNELERYIEGNQSFIQLEIYDNDVGEKHVIGTNPHDCLYVEGGVVYYYNLQNGEGSKYGTYWFVDKEIY